MGSGQLRDVILRELGSRPIFVLILSKNAIASRWVKREADRAEELIDRDPSRVFPPVTAAPIERTDFGTDNGWLAYYGYKRIEAPGFNPYAVQEAANRLLHALALTPVGEIPPSVAPQPSESVDDLITRGRALNAQRHYAEALPLFQRATQPAPGSFDAWFNTGYTLELLEHYDEALVADEHATALDPKSNAASFNEGNARTGLGRYEEALAAYERNFDANDARDWRGKGNALRNLSRYEEALAAYERAVTLDPTHAVGWTNKGITLDDLGRREEALAVYDRAIALDPDYAIGWYNKGTALEGLNRYEEALAAYERGFDPNDARDWRGKARCLRALGRTTEAAEAERRAKELDG
jgi:tetratricopeptide (TPR) repeat protein